jgi:hypothetical protein
VKRKLSSFVRRLRALKAGDLLIVLRVRGGFCEVPRRFRPRGEAKGKRA